MRVSFRRSSSRRYRRPCIRLDAEGIFHPCPRTAPRARRRGERGSSGRHDRDCRSWKRCSRRFQRLWPIGAQVAPDHCRGKTVCQCPIVRRVAPDFQPGTRRVLKRWADNIGFSTAACQTGRPNFSYQCAQSTGMPMKSRKPESSTDWSASLCASRSNGSLTFFSI